MKTVEIEIVVTAQQARAIADIMEVGAAGYDDDDPMLDVADGIATELRAAASGDPKLAYQFTSQAAEELAR